MDLALRCDDNNLSNELQSTPRRQDLSMNRKKLQGDHGFDGPALQSCICVFLQILISTHDQALEHLSVELLKGRVITLWHQLEYCVDIWKEVFTYGTDRGQF
jgi:hypothetical protein